MSVSFVQYALEILATEWAGQRERDAQEEGFRSSRKPIHMKFLVLILKKLGEPLFKTTAF